MPTAATASTARDYASAAVAPWPLSRFSPFNPSTCQTVWPELPVNAASPQLQPERWRESSAGGQGLAQGIIDGMPRQGVGVVDSQAKCSPMGTILGTTFSAQVL
jgi:hypothetical protein